MDVFVHRAITRLNVLVAENLLLQWYGGVEHNLGSR
jgi:hypothetical protein